MHYEDKRNSASEGPGRSGNMRVDRQAIMTKHDEGWDEPARGHLRVTLDDPSQISDYRARLRELLIARELEAERREAIVLAAAEAIDNAFVACRDGECRIEAVVSLVGDYVCVEVSDSGSGLRGACHDLSRLPSTDDEHGRGLFLMTALMESLEVVPRPRGTLVRMTSHLRRRKRHGGDPGPLAS
jgi:anti-sigma regulatory factor (Ser/Thr protein kinase)